MKTIIKSIEKVDPKFSYGVLYTSILNEEKSILVQTDYLSQTYNALSRSAFSKGNRLCIENLPLKEFVRDCLKCEFTVFEFDNDQEMLEWFVAP